ncbi:MAG: hypothetical protein RLZZ136_1613 [Pseudomonadota bacterium]
MSQASAVYVGHVIHRRSRPRVHHLRYRVFSLLLDLEELAVLPKRLRLFSHNRFNLFSFYDRDYGCGDPVPLRAQIEYLCAKAGVVLDGGAIRVLTMPRILGFAFNPLSVFYCHDRSGSLKAMLYEVNNTFGERHTYLIPVAGDTHVVRQRCDKGFHVSPFMAMAMDYAFRVVPPAARLSVAITVSDDAGPLLTALHTAQRAPLNDRVLARVFISHPLLTLKVVGGILWEAAKLWMKRVPVYNHPKPPAHPVTIVIPNAATTPMNPSQTTRETACI